MHPYPSSYPTPTIAHPYLGPHFRVPVRFGHRISRTRHLAFPPANPADLSGGFRLPQPNVGDQAQMPLNAAMLAHQLRWATTRHSPIADLGLDPSRPGARIASRSDREKKSVENRKKIRRQH